jgi:hypothetical protein
MELLKAYMLVLIIIQAVTKSSIAMIHAGTHAIIHVSLAMAVYGNHFLN